MGKGKEEFVDLRGMAMGGGGTSGWQGGDAAAEVVELVAGGGPVLVVGAKRSDRIRRRPVMADPVARSHWRWGRRRGQAVVLCGGGCDRGGGGIVSFPWQR
ncbi:hypothetical protein OsI_37653 [Oryza sativa Indica Group]|uniref:Uncharacterized protein n=1 Tax=Oryza sativa subsp. indica TaxID=39946 RepID=A2ZIK6_ORYSI|nr:hypothetical protein OsI_37653 [Oryza sativa Indica Group]